jgi:DNA-binding transcriptional ArsR family regulator
VRFVTSDLQVLVGLEDGARQYGELTEVTGLARSTVSRSVTRLSAHDIVERDQSGRAVTVRPQPTSVVDSIGTVRESAPHLDLYEFLTLARLRVVWFLTAPRPPSAIASFTDVSVNRVRQVLMTLQKRQIATETDAGVRLRADYEPLQSLAESVFDLFHGAEIEHEHPDATVVWTAPKEALFSASTAEASGSSDATVVETGLRQFTRWGLEFRSPSSPMYYRSTLSDSRGPTAMEAIVHTLCRRADNRRLTYSAVLLAEAVTNGSFSRNRFLELADYYGVVDVARYLPALVVVSTESMPREQRRRRSERAGRQSTGSENSESATGKPDRSAVVRDRLPSPVRVRDTAMQYGVDIAEASEKLERCVDTDLLREIK